MTYQDDQAQKAILDKRWVEMQQIAAEILLMKETQALAHQENDALYSEERRYLPANT